MTDLLSEEWLAGLKGRTVAGADVSGVFQYLVTGAPGGKVTYWVRVDAGSVVDAGSGPADQPDIAFEVAHKELGPLDAGEVEPGVAYMQGRLKADGDMQTLFALLRSAHQVA